MNLETRAQQAARGVHESVAGWETEPPRGGQKSSAPPVSVEWLLDFVELRRRRERIIAAVLALILAAAGLSVGVRALVREQSARPAQTPQLPLAGDVVARIPLPRYAVAISVGEGAVWVAGSPRHQIREESLPPVDDLRAYPEEAAPEDVRSQSPQRAPYGTVTRIDPGTNQVTTTIEVGGNPYDLVAAYGAVWVADAAQSRALRIDPVSNQATAIPLPTAVASVTAAAGSVWFTSYGASSVFRIDPKTSQVVATITMGEIGYKEIRSFGDAIWVGHDANRRLSEIDPATNSVRTEVASFADNFSAYGQIAVGRDALWAGVGDTLVRIDPTSDRVVSRIRLETSDLDESGSAVGAAEDIPNVMLNATSDSIWVAVTGVVADGGPSRVASRLLRIDPSTHEVVAAVQIERTGSGAALFAMAIEGRSLWVIDSRAHELVRLDIAEGK